VHAEVHRQDLFGAPGRHWLGHNHGARDDFVLRRARSLDSRTHFSQSGPSSSFDSAAYDVACLFLRETIGRVIWLRAPGRRFRLKQLDSPAVKHSITAADGSEHDEH
jgi:hypothetical protein